jgi:hypothetical protein
MSIKYLQDQQLNQVQQSPNNSPWAKLVAQSEMLERNKMRQPQGQAPQGTVAGNIQQQLMATQQQEGERENADLYKSQMLAQLIGSGQIPANFAAQGYASGGLTQPGTGTYAGIMVPGKPQNPMGMPTTYTPPNSQDPNAQEKKHGMLQSLLDNSIVGMAQGKANIGNAMQDYADLFSGKIFSRGFAEGGDIRGFAGGGGLEKFLNRYPSHPSIFHKQAAEERAAKLRAIQEQAAGAQRTLPAPGPTSASSLEAVLGKDANVQDFINSLNAKQAAANSAPARPQEIPTAPQFKALPHIAQVSESPELQEYYKSLYEPKPDATRGDILSQLGKANAPGEDQMRIPTREDMMRQAQGPSTGTDSLAEFKNRMYGADPSVVNPARSNLMGTLLNVAEQKETVNPARSNLMGTLLNVAEQKEALANQPKPSMTEKLREAGMAGYNDNTILDTMANKMSATDRINAANKPDIPVEPAAPDAWSGAEAGKGLGEELKGVGQGIAGLFKGPVGVAGKALRAVAPVGDLMAVNDVTGSPLPMLAKAAGVNVPSSIGGVPVSQGSPSQLAMDLMGSPTARLNQVGSGISDAAQYVGDKATSAYDQFKNRLDSAQGTGTPYTPPAETSPNVAPWLNEAVNKQQTPPQTPAPDKAKFASSANKSEKAAENIQVRDKVFNQGPTANTTEGHPVGDAVTRLSALAQTDQAMNKTSDTGMGQGSILDSLYSKLKDSDVDYSDLAKRISQNEYDLARERKDGTLNAILGGVGAALSKAGSYEGVGDRVFKPGLGAIAGAGIMGGLKMSAASDEAIDKKSQDNMVAALALKKLKRESMNDVLDAISAQRQVSAIERGQDITAGVHRDTNQTNIAELGVKNRMADAAELSAKADAMFKSAQAKKLNIEITDANDKLLVDSLNKQLGDYANLLSGADKTLNLTPEQRQGYQARLDGTQSQLDAIYAKYGSIAPKLKPLGSGQYQGFKNLTDQ